MQTQGMAKSGLTINSHSSSTVRGPKNEEKIHTMKNWKLNTLTFRANKYCMKLNKSDKVQFIPIK